MTALHTLLWKKLARATSGDDRGGWRRAGRTYLAVNQLEARDVPTSNPIVVENQLPGTPQSVWDVSGNGDATIQGFATDISVNHGQTINFKINDTAAAAYHIDIYRVGYYQGNGARLEATIGSSQTLHQVQPSPLTDPTTGLIDCGNWAVSASWAVPSAAVSGVYFARVVRDDTGGASQILFVVRADESHSDLLVQTSDATWQAYNTYGGNSLYGPNGDLDLRAYAVSYNRPLNDRGTPGGLGSNNNFFSAEYPMVRWLEANGYDASYFTDVDSDRNGALIENHKVFLSVGHDEYWSGGQVANMQAARDAGVNMAFFSGNEGYWKTRWTTSIDASGTPYRTLVCYKESLANAKIDPLPGVWTGLWLDSRFSPPADGGHPENALTGTLFTVNRGANDVGTPITASAAFADLRFWRNTAVANLTGSQTLALGQSVLGYEWDEDVDNGARPAGLFDLSATTQTVTQKVFSYDDDDSGGVSSGTATHSLTLYRANSGALVFGAGTVQWSWGLDGVHDGTATTPDLNMKQATVNLLADMNAEPGTLQAGLVAATASTDHSAPTTAITAPAVGASVPSGALVTITGTAADAGGGVVAAVEVSTDGGVTWHRATGQNTWTYTWIPGPLGSVAIRTRAIDDSGNIETPGTGVTVTVGAPIGSLSVWPTTATPRVTAAPDGAAVELGVKFKTDINGFIAGLRFYKGATNTGTHVGHLWTTGGVLLASATFTSETASGWQQVTFATPVAVTAGTTYVASYFAPNGHYAADAGYFMLGGTDSGPLHVLADGAASGGNGVYLYAAGGGFPINSYEANNYWVDVVFNTTGPTDTTPPTVSGQSPAPGATGVVTGTAVTATFSESVQSATINFTLKDPSNNAVPATVGYDDATHAATLTPNAALAASTTYTATVSGAKDQAGNTMVGSVSWSFTTEAPGADLTMFGTATPAVAAANDSGAVELGVKFHSDVGGTVTGVRFYKGAGNTGTHVGHLWTSTGTLLGTVTFTGETASGWQLGTFATPVAISANTTYVVSYFAPAGHYADTSNYFASGADSGVLHAPSSASSGGNGLYLYAAAGGFPTNSFNATNYWVDVDFTTVADTTPPTVTGKTPAPGATGVAPGTAVSASFSEPVQSPTVRFALTDPSGAGVPASFNYDGNTQTATLTPNDALAPLTTYTATVSGAKDLAGNTMTGSVTWSFTTGSVWQQTSAADFGAGTLSGTVVTNSSGGEVQLAPSFADDFNGSSLGSAWASTSWASAGGGPLSVTVAGGTLSLAGGEVLATSANANVRPVEGRISFGATPYQHFGLATDLASVTGNSWAIFSTAGTSNTLFARVNASGATQDVSLGTLPSGFHVYLIKPATGAYQFFVDGVLLTTISATIPNASSMKIAFSSFNGAPQPALQVDWVRLDSYPASGTFVSSVFDAGGTVTWGTVNWTANVPSGTTIVIETSSSTDGVNWSSWAQASNGSAVASPTGRYLRYRITFTTTDPTQTASLSDISFNWS
jgi:hypothetical protein